MNTAEKTDRYLTGPQVLKRYGITGMSLHRWIHNPDVSFPKPLKIARRNYFSETEVVAWERDRAAGRAA